MESTVKEVEQSDAEQTVNADTHYYFYKKKYKTKAENRLRFHNNLKGNILEFISENKLFKSLDVWEAIKLKDVQWVHKNNICVDNILKKNALPYAGIELKNLSFFEVVEIDDFVKFRQRLIANFATTSGDFGRNDELELRKKLEGIETSFDSVSFGRLLSINFEKRKSDNHDLVHSVDCSYIKTNESYFIIRFDIRLSKKALKIIGKIIDSKDTAVYVPNYNGYYRIFKTKRFYASESFLPSLKAINFNHFISDVSTQVKLNVTKNFPGFFHQSNVFETLPSIQLFEVDDIANFSGSDDKGLLYNDDIRKTFSLSDKQIELRLSDSWRDSREAIQIVKQKGHGNRTSNRSDLTDYSNLENHDLLSSLSFPCAFAATLKEHAFRLNALKREIYDQIKVSGNKFIWKDLLFFHRTKKYLRHKHLSIQMLLTMKRFEQEFTDENILRFSRHYSLQAFESNYKHQNEVENLPSYLKKAFRYQINKLETSTRNLNEVFKSLEELNGYKTNLVLQLFSLVIAVLAFVFAFDKAKQFIEYMFDLLR